MNTDEIRNEFAPAEGSRLAINLDAIDLYRRRVDKLRAPYESLHAELLETGETARTTSTDYRGKAQAQAVLPSLREATGDARRAYELAQGKLVQLTRDTEITVGMLRNYKAELAEIEAWRADNPHTEEQKLREKKLVVIESKQQTSKMRAGQLRSFLDTWLAPDEGAQRTGLARLVQEAQAAS